MCWCFEAKFLKRMLSYTSTPPTLAARVESVSKENSGSLADLLQGEMRAWTPARGTPSWLIGDPELLLYLDRVRMASTTSGNRKRNEKKSTEQEEAHFVSLWV